MAILDIPIVEISLDSVEESTGGLVGKLSGVVDAADLINSDISKSNASGVKSNTSSNQISEFVWS